MTMEWETLLSCERPEGHKTFYTSPPSPGRSDFERDYSRILYSNPFRRLQNKTQVYPMPENDHVHTRLTHSLEVADTGKALGKLVGEKILKIYPKLKYTKWDFGYIVAAACLGHDIGNPPFGHAGEETVKEYFKRESFAEYAHCLSKQELSDLQNFEGNAQGFRILTTIGDRYSKGGMRLTAATLATYCKYPQSSTCIDKNDVSRKKYNFFNSELDIFRSVAERVGLINRPGIDSWCRHPLAFLTEAADDICYNILDLEDGFRLGLIKYEDVEQLLQPIANARSEVAELERECEKIGVLRGRAIGNLVSAVTDVFLWNLDDILEGNYKKSLIETSSFASELKEISRICTSECYHNVGVAKIESAGNEVLTCLLDKMLAVVKDPKHRLDSLIKSLLRDKFIYSLFNQESAYKKILTIVDLITGMTDRFAITLYRQLKGMTVRAL